MPADTVSAGSKATQQLHSVFLRTVLRHGRSPETERHKDEWDAWVFGHGGTVRFTKISQPWLREATKHWALDDLPKRRGASATNTVQAHVNAIALLSESLRLQRGDNGNNPAVLGDGTSPRSATAWLTYTDGATSPPTHAAESLAAPAACSFGCGH